MAQRARDLLEDARDFLGAGEDLFKTRRWSKVCFACQQAAELALRAALNSLGLERRGHVLGELLDELSKHEKMARRLSTEAAVLDQYYISTRYANSFAGGAAHKHYTQMQAADALETTRKILKEAGRIVAARKAQERGKKTHKAL